MLLQNFGGGEGNEVDYGQLLNSEVVECLKYFATGFSCGHCLLWQNLKPTYVSSISLKEGLSRCE